MVSINLESNLESQLRELQRKLQHKTFTQTLEHFLRLGLQVYDEKKEFEKADISNMQQQLVKALVDIQGLRIKMQNLEPLVHQVIADVASFSKDD
jgi:hypothetical protein